MAGADDVLGATCDAISHGSLMGARGNSGVILSPRSCAGSADHAQADSRRGATPPAEFAEALDRGRRVAAYGAVMKPGRGHDPHRRPGGGGGRAASAADGAPTTLVDGAPRRRSTTATTALRNGRPSSSRCSRRPVSSTPAGPGYVLLLDAAAARHRRPTRSPNPSSWTARPVPWSTCSQRTAIDDSGGAGDHDGVSRPALRGHVLPRGAPTRRVPAFKDRAGPAIGDSIVVVGGDGTLELPHPHRRHRRGHRGRGRPRWSTEARSGSPI